MASNMQSDGISRIGLGTVQFGFDYGINNSRGQVPYDEVCRILEYGSEKGITFLDTSRAYGESETVLGRALEETGLSGKYEVCTKLDLPKDYQNMSDRELEKTTRQSLAKSLEALRLNAIPIYLLHTYDYMRIRDGLVWSVLVSELHKGRIGILGVSIGRGPEEALEGLKDPHVRAIQIPYNVFDHRWEQQGVFDSCRDNNIVLINRSTYLQGLLLMEPEKAVLRVPAAKGYISELHRIARRLNLSVKELVFRFVLQEDAIASTLIGVDSLEQLTENIDLYEKGRLDEEIVETIRKVFMGTPVELVNPALWNIPYPHN